MRTTDVGYLGDGILKEGETSELARAGQNPIADLISVPFQNNTNFKSCHEQVFSLLSSRRAYLQARFFSRGFHLMPTDPVPDRGHNFYFLCFHIYH